MDISFTPAAEMIVEHLLPPDRKRIDRSLERLRGGKVENLVEDSQKLSRENVWVWKASPDLRILFRRRKNAITIVDVFRQSQVDAIFFGTDDERPKIGD